MANNIPPPPPGFTLDQSGEIPPPPAGFQLDSESADPADVAKVSNLYHLAVAAGNDIAAQHLKGWLGAHNAQLAAPDAQTQAKVADIAKTLADAHADMHLDNSAGGTFAGAGLGLIHHLANVGLGTAQGIANVGDYVGNKLGTNALDSATNDFNQYMKDREQTYQAVTQGNIGSYVGGAVGEVAPYLLGGVPRALDKLGTTVASKVVPEAAARALPRTANLARNVISGATQGAAISAVQPVTNVGASSRPDLSSLITGPQGGPTYFSQKGEQIAAGGVLGGALPMAGAVVRNVADVGQHVFRPQAVAGRMLANTLGDTPETVAALRNPQTLVPGETPTSAQVVPSPEAFAAQKKLGNTPQGAIDLANTANNNNAARVQVLRGIAGTDDDMAKALQARKDATQPFVQKYLGDVQTAPTNPVAVDSAPILKQLSNIILGPAGRNPVVNKGAQAIARDIKSAANPDGTVDAGHLDAIRQNVKNFLQQHAPNGVVGNVETKAIAPIRNQIVESLDAAVPGYRDYLAAYAKHSQPINDMESARAALAPVESGVLNTGGDSQLTLGRLNQALRRDDNATYGLSPEARAKFDAIRDSLQREGTTMRSPGSDTQYNQASALSRNLFGPNYGGPSAKAKAAAMMTGAILGEHIGGPWAAATGAGIGGLLGKGAQMVNDNIMGAYSKGLINPKEAATAIEAYLKKNPKNAKGLLKQFPQWRTLLMGGTQNSMVTQ